LDNLNRIARNRMAARPEAQKPHITAHDRDIRFPGLERE
jgi:hypothetical protein